MADDEPSLATVLSRWIRRERLRPIDIHRAAGITRPHLWLLLNDRVARPEPETLRKLALAVATDPDTKAVDRLKRDEALRDFSRAAGYPASESDLDAGDLVRAIRAVVGNQQSTDFWCEMIKAHGDISPTLQQLIRTVIDLHNRPGGKDTTAMLDLIRSLTGDGEPARS